MSSSHAKAKALRRGGLQCPICDYVADSRNLLLAHKAMTHMIETEYKCSKCHDQSFKSELEALQHAMSEHVSRIAAIVPNVKKYRPKKGEAPNSHSLKPELIEEETIPELASDDEDWVPDRKSRKTQNKTSLVRAASGDSAVKNNGVNSSRSKPKVQSRKRQPELIEEATILESASNDEDWVPDRKSCKTQNKTTLVRAASGNSAVKNNGVNSSRSKPKVQSRKRQRRKSTSDATSNDGSDFGAKKTPPKRTRGSSAKKAEVEEEVFEYGKTDKLPFSMSRDLTLLRNFSIEMGFPNAQDRKEFQCQFCGTLFRTLHDLILHTNGDHFDNALFQCDVCDRYFDRHGELWDHQVTEHKLEPGSRYPCAFCDSKFARKINNKHHMREKHGAPGCKYMCTECDAGFRYRERLVLHMQAKHEIVEDGPDVRQCQMCDFKAVNHKRLNKHMRKEHNQCIQCGKTFETQEAMRKHMAMDHNHNPAVQERK